MPKLMTKRTFSRIERMLRNDRHTQTAIADHVGVTATVVARIAEGKHFYQAGEQERHRRSGRNAGCGKRLPNYLPTPEEIAEACEAIQEARLLARDDDNADGWTPPVYSERLLVVCG